MRWAKGARRDGGVAIEQPRVLERLAKAHVHATASALVYYRSLWRMETGANDRAAGPMSKVFSSELFLRDATDLFDLAAPDTLLRGKHDLGFIELAGRHASATTIYAGHQRGAPLHGRREGARPAPEPLRIMFEGDAR